MKTLDLKIHVDPDHHLEIDLPSDFPTGPARLHVVSESRESGGREPVVAGGMLRDESWEVPEDSDPIADALEEVRRERNRSLEAAIREYSDD